MKCTYISSTDLQTDEGLMENLRPFVQTNGSVNFGLQHFTYSNPVLADNIYYHLSQTNFKGIVVRVRYTDLLHNTRCTTKYIIAAKKVWLRLFVSSNGSY